MKREKITLKTLIKVVDISDGKGEAYEAVLDIGGNKSVVWGGSFQELRQGIQLSLDVIEEEYKHAHTVNAQP